MLDSIPTNYGQAYRDTFDRITRQSPDRKRLALSALIWICYAKRALGMTELRHAISSMDENPQYDSECLEPATAILSSCYGLIVYSKSSQTVDMVHSSARSFLLEQLKVYSENPNIIIGRACMNYMAVPEMGKGPCQTLDQLKARVTEMPFLDYATRYYGYHICPVEDALLPELLHFLENGQFRESSWQLLHFVINIESESAQDLITSVPSHATLLHVSCYWDFSSSVRKLLATPSGLEMLNQADSHGWTPLHWASSNGHSQLVTNLLDAGATIDTIDQAFWTPLFWAVMRGHDAVARLLLERGSSPFDQDQTCLTPVHWAILTGNTEIAEMLLDNAIHSPLRYQSANHGLTTPINQLTVEGAKAAFHPPQTKNLFQLAAEISDTERFQKLARKYGDFFSINKIGFDTWNINEMWDTSKIVFSKADISFWRRLRDKAPVDGVRIEILTKAIQCEDVNLVRSILDFSRDMGKDLANEAVSRYESGYVHVAAYSGSAEIMRMFKHAGFPLTATDSRGFTPLHYACRTGTPEVSDVILEAGVDVDALDKERRTPLMLLLQYGIWRTCHKPGDTCAMLNALVAKGASIHAKDAAGHQPIHYAMSTMDPDIVQLLVDRGADTGAISDDLWTPLHALAAGPIGKFRTRALELEGHLREYKMIRVRADQTRRMMELALRISPSWVIQAETAAKATALALAIKASSWQLAQGLHAANAPFRSKDDLSKALNRVAEHGFYEFTRMLIQAGITAKGTTLLPRMSVMQPAQKPHRWESTLFGIHDYEALPARDYSLVLKELLDLGVDVHQTDSYLRLTPIQLAAERGVQDSAYLATLLEGGADPYAETNEGLDSFDLALLCGKLDNLAILVQHAARDLSRDNWLANWLRESRTVPQGDQDCFNACLAAIRHSGRHASYIKNGHTLLFYAAREGNLVLTDELINLGAKVGLRDPLGWTPFHEAVRNHRVDVVEFLISKGANVLWTVDDTLPFSESTRRPNPDEPTPIINALHIVVGIHPHWLSVEDRNRLTPNIVRLLLENGIDPNGKALNVGSCRENSGGNLMYDLRTVDGSASPLQILFRKSGPKHPEEFFAIVQLLIDFGADVRGIAEKMDIWDVALFEGYEHLWDLFRSAEPVS